MQRHGLLQKKFKTIIIEAAAMIAMTLVTCYVLLATNFDVQQTGLWACIAKLFWL
jgi:hypothetical protein